MPKLASNGHLYNPRKFIVEGDGRFPIDCLRYDAAWPAEERDSNLIAGADYDTTRRAVILTTRWPSAPTKGRWQAYGWRVMWMDGMLLEPSTPALEARLKDIT